LGEVRSLWDLQQALDQPGAVAVLPPLREVVNLLGSKGREKMDGWMEITVHGNGQGCMGLWGGWGAVVCDSRGRDVWAAVRALLHTQA
jgi:hypothetical protein